MGTARTSQTDGTIMGGCCDYVVTIGDFEPVKVENPLILLVGRLVRFSQEGLCYWCLKWWLGAELNRRHKDFQSSALPTELPSQP